MLEKVSVVVPVGPFPANKRWLSECLASLKVQTHEPDEVVVIDDMAGITLEDLKPLYKERMAAWSNSAPGVTTWRERFVTLGRRSSPTGRAPETGDSYETYARIWYSPWRLGVAHAFNFGVAIARNELVFMLGSDDYLEPTALEEAVRTWQDAERQDGYYYATVRYLDERPQPIQTEPCGAAMVTKGCWRLTGGFAVESAVGTSDANLISQMLVHNAVPLIPIAPGRPLYNYRPHGNTDTASKGPWQGVIIETRNLLTQAWQPPAWGRLDV